MHRVSSFDRRSLKVNIASYAQLTISTNSAKYEVALVLFAHG